MLDHAYDLGHLPPSGEILRYSTKYHSCGSGDSRAPSTQAHDVDLAIPTMASNPQIGWGEWKGL